MTTGDLAKPTALAAGQAWECGSTLWILDGPSGTYPSFWNARTSIGQGGLLSAKTIMGMRFVGASAEPLPPCGTRAWLFAALSRLLFVDETRIHVDESTPMVARVTVDGCSLAPVALACAILQEEMPAGVRLTAGDIAQGPGTGSYALRLLDAASGAWLDGIAEGWGETKREPGETDAALRSRLRAVPAGPAVILHELQGLPIETPPAHLALLTERAAPPERDRTAAEYFAGKGERYSPAGGWER